MKAGLLLPRSKEYPAIAADLTVALRRCLKENGKEEEVQFVSENIGFGESEKEIYDKAEKLLLIENADVLIAYADMKVMAIIEPLIFATGKLMIVLNTGANMPEKKIPQPGIIYLTLQQSFCCSLTGKAAGNENGVYATTFYDCGYMHGAALMETFAANGGNILYNYINNDKTPDVFNIKGLTDFLSAQPEKKINLLCIFDSAPASLFYKQLNEYEYADQLSLFVSPMMLTKSAIGEGGYRFSIHGYTSWLPETDTVENNRFNEIYRDEYKKDPGIFSLSAWQAGLLVMELIKERAVIAGDSDETVAAISKIILNAPNADLRSDPATGFYIADKIYEGRLDAGEKKLNISSVAVSESMWTDFVQSQSDYPPSGWMNTYLCY